MAKSTRRARLILVAVVFGLVVVGVLGWKPLYWWVMTKQEETVGLGGKGNRGYRTVNRWTGENLGNTDQQTVYNVLSGFKRSEYFIGHDESVSLRLTTWRIDGTVGRQKRILNGHTEKKSSPPWWWGVTDQTEPTAPWWKGGE